MRKCVCSQPSQMLSVLCVEFCVEEDWQRRVWKTEERGREASDLRGCARGGRIAACRRSSAASLLLTFDPSLHRHQLAVTPTMAFVAPAVRYPDSLNSSLDSLVAPIRASLGEAFKDVPSLLILAPLLLLPVVLLALNNSTGSARRRAVTAAPVPVKSRGTPAVLLAGPSSSGKTSLWHALSLRIACNDAIPAAHTSQLISRCEAKVDGRNVKLIDAPGHARLRHLEETQVGKADAVVFCIDVGAARGQGEAMREAAE